MNYYWDGYRFFVYTPISNYTFDMELEYVLSYS